MKLAQRLAIGYIQTKFKVLAAISKRKAAEKAFLLFCTPYLKSKPHIPAFFALANPLKFVLEGQTVFGWEFLPKNELPVKTILILHGFGSAAYKFQNFIKPLTGKGYRVLAFDAPAHGSSHGKKVNAILYSEMILHIAEKFGLPDGFIAHSFGGIALSLALEKIPHTTQTKIAFIAPATETSTAVDQAFSMLKLHDKEVQKEFHNIIFALSGKPTEWFSMRRAIKNIKADILWIHDKEDDITPYSDALKVKSDEHPNIKFIITSGLGHRKIYHDADVKKKVIGFL
jgi:pimeloyl-ACP methyl ester carboxylesterase